MGDTLKGFVTCARNLEPFVANELRLIGATDIAPSIGGVAFAGDLAIMYRANLELRTAVRVLIPILEARTPTPDALYEAVSSLDWSRYMTPDHTLAVDCNVRDSGITHSQYAARRVKDAICDQFRAKCGLRPSVDPERPMVGLNLHIHRNKAVLSLDSSGDSLHKRGYRPKQTIAPINEALAAALVQATGYVGTQPFVDPMCGGGTLPIEAAWLALNRPPGLTRKHFGFMGWMDFDVRLFTQLRDAARAAVRRVLPALVQGSDIRPDAITLAVGNARSAGIANLVNFSQADIRDFRPPEGPPGIVLINPPYGERIGEDQELFPLYETIGQVFAERCRGWKCFVFSGNPQLADRIGLPTTAEMPFFNGKIRCMLLKYEPA